MKLKIVTLGNSVLKEQSKKVEKFDEKLEEFVESMFETLKVSNGIGLAAPQVDVSKRLFIVLLEDDEEYVFINPEIIETSSDLVAYEEGCLSIPGIFTDIERPSKVTVYAQDVKGKNFKVEASGILARVIQHENDHLNGKLFIDRVNEEKREVLVHQYEKKCRRSRILHGRK